MRENTAGDGLTGTGDRVRVILETLKREYPNAQISLHFSTPLELFVAVILSAQCSDKMVNRVTPYLFQRYQTVEEYAQAKVSDLEKIIRPLGLYRNKARNIIKACQIMKDLYDSQIPCTMKDLLQLPGVARKTANVILYHAYGIVAGIAVDTHVMRLSKRLGFTCEKNPEKIEKDLCQMIPREEWKNVNHLLIAHGRRVCTAPIPHCSACALTPLCPSYHVYMPSIEQGKNVRPSPGARNKRDS